MENKTMEQIIMLNATEMTKEWCEAKRNGVSARDFIVDDYRAEFGGERDAERVASEIFGAIDQLKEKTSRAAGEGLSAERSNDLELASIVAEYDMSQKEEFEFYSSVKYGGIEYALAMIDSRLREDNVDVELMREANDEARLAEMTLADEEPTRGEVEALRVEALESLNNAPVVTDDFGIGDRLGDEDRREIQAVMTYSLYKTISVGELEGYGILPEQANPESLAYFTASATEQVHNMTGAGEPGESGYSAGERVCGTIAGIALLALGKLCIKTGIATFSAVMPFFGEGLLYALIGTYSAAVIAVAGVAAAVVGGVVLAEVITNGKLPTWDEFKQKAKEKCERTAAFVKRNFARLIGFSVNRVIKPVINAVKEKIALPLYRRFVKMKNWISAKWTRIKEYFREAVKADNRYSFDENYVREPEEYFYQFE